MSRLICIYIGLLAVTGMALAQTAPVQPPAQPPAQFPSRPNPIPGVSDDCMKTITGPDALDALEKSCKSELQKSHEFVNNVYISWLGNDVGNAVSCSKDSKGDYCLASLANATRETQEQNKCTDCQRILAEQWVKWTPSRSNNDTSALVAQMTELHKQRAAQCNVSTKPIAATTTTTPNASSILQSPSTNLINLTIVAMIGALMLCV
ncbi:hypothetical protein BDF19DRAFT_453627 [Syncephalis fuscata]|nr:hypothetical protein BDF19DRAFT_453627 [Syncephalis fuscata]